MHRKLTYVTVALFGVLACMNAGIPTIHAQAMNDNEVKVTVALIYRASDFFTWPDERFDSDDSEFIIGVHGSDKMTSELRIATKGRDIKGHPIKIVEIDDLDEAEHLHVLYIASEKVSDYVDAPKDDAEKHAILTVSDSADFMDGGGILRIFIKNEKPKLQVNVDAARRHQLVVSSQFLKLAEVVSDGA